MTEAELVALLRRRAGDASSLAIAFSAGLDSTALARLAVEAGLRPVLLHVDHGTDSAPSARQVAQRLSAELGLELRVLKAEFDEQGGGFEATARRARYQALEAAWRGTVWLAQTRDDWIETVWMRFLSGSTPVYWSTMPERRGRFERPLITVRRSLLQRRSSGAHADPMNASDRFDRVHLRRSGVLERIDPEGALADVISGIGVRVRRLQLRAWDVPLEELTMELRVLSVRAALADLWRGVRVRQSFVRELAQAAGRPSRKTRRFCAAGRTVYLRDGRLVLSLEEDVESGATRRLGEE